MKVELRFVTSSSTENNNDNNNEYDSLTISFPSSSSSDSHSSILYKLKMKILLEYFLPKINNNNNNNNNNRSSWYHHSHSYRFIRLFAVLDNSFVEIKSDIVLTTILKNLSFVFEKHTDSIHNDDGDDDDDDGDTLVVLPIHAQVIPPHFRQRMIINCCGGITRDNVILDAPSFFREIVADNSKSSEEQEEESTSSLDVEQENGVNPSFIKLFLRWLNQFFSYVPDLPVEFRDDDSLVFAANNSKQQRLTNLATLSDLVTILFDSVGVSLREKFSAIVSNNDSSIPLLFFYIERKTQAALHFSSSVSTSTTTMQQFQQELSHCMDSLLISNNINILENVEENINNNSAQSLSSSPPFIENKEVDIFVSTLAKLEVGVPASFQSLAWCVACCQGYSANENMRGSQKNQPTIDKVRVTRNHPWRWLVSEITKLPKSFFTTLKNKSCCFELFSSSINCSENNDDDDDDDVNHHHHHHDPILLYGVACVIFNRNSVPDPRVLFLTSPVLSSLASWVQLIVRIATLTILSSTNTSSSSSSSSPAPQQNCFYWAEKTQQLLDAYDLRTRNPRPMTPRAAKQQRHDSHKLKNVVSSSPTNQPKKQNASNASEEQVPWTMIDSNNTTTLKSPQNNTDSDATSKIPPRNNNKSKEQQSEYKSPSSLRQFTLGLPDDDDYYRSAARYLTSSISQHKNLLSSLLPASPLLTSPSSPSPRDLYLNSNNNQQTSERSRRNAKIQTLEQLMTEYDQVTLIAEEEQRRIRRERLLSRFQVQQEERNFTPTTTNIAIAEQQIEEAEEAEKRIDDKDEDAIEIANTNNDQTSHRTQHNEDSSDSKSSRAVIRKKRTENNLSVFLELVEKFTSKFHHKVRFISTSRTKLGNKFIILRIPTSCVLSPLLLSTLPTSNSNDAASNQNTDTQKITATNTFLKLLSRTIETQRFLAVQLVEVAAAFVSSNSEENEDQNSESDSDHESDDDNRDKNTELVDVSASSKISIFVNNSSNQRKLRNFDITERHKINELFPLFTLLPIASTTPFVESDEATPIVSDHQNMNVHNDQVENPFLEPQIAKNNATTTPIGIPKNNNTFITPMPKKYSSASEMYHHQVEEGVDYESDDDVNFDDEMTKAPKIPYPPSESKQNSVNSSLTTIKNPRGMFQNNQHNNNEDASGPCRSSPATSLPKSGINPNNTFLLQLQVQENNGCNTNMLKEVNLSDFAPGSSFLVEFTSTDEVDNTINDQRTNRFLATFRIEELCAKPFSVSRSTQQQTSSIAAKQATTSSIRNDNQEKSHKIATKDPLDSPCSTSTLLSHSNSELQQLNLNNNSNIHKEGSSLFSSSSLGSGGNASFSSSHCVLQIKNFAKIIETVSPETSNKKKYSTLKLHVVNPLANRKTSVSSNEDDSDNNNNVIHPVRLAQVEMKHVDNTKNDDDDEDSNASSTAAIITMYVPCVDVVQTANCHHKIYSENNSLIDSSLYLAGLEFELRGQEEQIDDDDETGNHEKGLSSRLPVEVILARGSLDWKNAKARSFVEMKRVRDSINKKQQHDMENRETFFIFLSFIGVTVVEEIPKQWTIVSLLSGAELLQDATNQQHLSDFTSTPDLRNDNDSNNHSGLSLQIFAKKLPKQSRINPILIEQQPHSFIFGLDITLRNYKLFGLNSDVVHGTFALPCFVSSSSPSSTSSLFFGSSAAAKKKQKKSSSSSSTTELEFEISRKIPRLSKDQKQNETSINTITEELLEGSTFINQDEPICRTVGVPLRHEMIEHVEATTPSEKNHGLLENNLHLEVPELTITGASPIKSNAVSRKELTINNNNTHQHHHGDVDHHVFRQRAHSVMFSLQDLMVPSFATQPTTETNHEIDDSSALPILQNHQHDEIEHDLKNNKSLLPPTSLLRVSLQTAHVLPGSDLLHHQHGNNNNTNKLFSSFYTLLVFQGFHSNDYPFVKLRIKNGYHRQLSSRDIFIVSSSIAENDEAENNNNNILRRSSLANNNNNSNSNSNSRSASRLSRTTSLVVGSKIQRSDSRMFASTTNTTSMKNHQQHPPQDDNRILSSRKNSFSAPTSFIPMPPLGGRKSSMNFVAFKEEENSTNIHHRNENDNNNHLVRRSSISSVPMNSTSLKEKKQSMRSDEKIKKLTSTSLSVPSFVVPHDNLADDWLSIDVFEAAEHFQEQDHEQEKQPQVEKLIGRIAVPLKENASGMNNNNNQKPASSSSSAVRTLSLTVMTPDGPTKDKSTLTLSIATLGVPKNLMSTEKNRIKNVAMNAKHEISNKFKQHATRFSEWWCCNKKTKENASPSQSVSNFFDSDDFLHNFWLSHRHSDEEVPPIVDLSFPANSVYSYSSSLLKQQSVFWCKPRHFLSAGGIERARMFPHESTNGNNGIVVNIPTAASSSSLSSLSFFQNDDLPFINALTLLQELPQKIISRTFVKQSHELWQTFNCFGLYLRSLSHDGELIRVPISANESDENNSSNAQFTSKMAMIVPILTDDWLPCTTSESENNNNNNNNTSSEIVAASLGSAMISPLRTFGGSMEYPILWPSAMQKCVAKHFGSYDCVADLDLAMSMEMISGMPCDEGTIPMLSTGTSNVDDEIFVRVLRRMKKQLLTSSDCGIKAISCFNTSIEIVFDKEENNEEEEKEDNISDTEENDENNSPRTKIKNNNNDKESFAQMKKMIESKGLQLGRSYPILDIVFFDETFILVLCRDPVRPVTHWNGQYRRGSPLWKRNNNELETKMKNALVSKSLYEKDDSTFWISLDEIKQVFEAYSMFYYPSSLQNETLIDFDEYRFGGGNFIHQQHQTQDNNAPMISSYTLQIDFKAETAAAKQILFLNLTCDTCGVDIDSQDEGRTERNGMMMKVTQKEEEKSNDTISSSVVHYAASSETTGFSEPIRKTNDENQDGESEDQFFVYNQRSIGCGFEIEHAAGSRRRITVELKFRGKKSEHLNRVPFTLSMMSHPPPSEWRLVDNVVNKVENAARDFVSVSQLKNNTCCTSLIFPEKYTTTKY